MKFLVAGDVHGDLNAFERLAEKAEAENVDAIILSGDFTFFDEIAAGTFTRLKKSGKKIFVIPGNHETLSTLDFAIEKYGIYSLHGYSFDINGVGFFGAGGANIGPYLFSSEDELNSLLKKSHEKIKDTKKKVLITHIHPSSSLVHKVSGISGSEAVRKAISKFKPDFAIFSHLHEAHGIEEKIGDTKLLCIGKEGVIVEI